MAKTLCDADLDRGLVVCAQQIFRARNNQKYQNETIENTKSCMTDLMTKHWNCTAKFKSAKDKAGEAIEKAYFLKIGGSSREVVNILEYDKARQMLKKAERVGDFTLQEFDRAFVRSKVLSYDEMKIASEALIVRRRRTRRRMRLGGGFINSP